MPKEGRTTRTYNFAAPSIGKLVFAFVIAFATNAFAQEQATAFLERLYARKYYDVALDYLDEIEKREGTSAELKSEVQLYRARTLQRSIELVTGAAREKRLEETTEAFVKFITEQPGHPRSHEARVDVARLLRARGQQKIIAAKSVEESKRANLQKQANDLIHQSSVQFLALRDDLRRRLEPLEAKSNNNDTPLTAEEFETQRNYRNQYVQAWLGYAYTLEDQADAANAGSQESNELLKKALAEFSLLAKKYASDRTEGVDARIHEGICNQKLGDLPAAIKIFVEVIELARVSEGISKEPARRLLGLQSLVRAMDCWLDARQKAYPAAISASAPWLSDVQPSEESDPLWVHLKYLTAVAHKKFADEVKAKDPKDENAKKAIVEARKLALQVSKVDSVDQAPARKLLAEMGVEVAAVTLSSLGKIKTFEEAREAGREAFNGAVELPERVGIIKERLSVEKDPAQIEVLKKELESAQGGATQSFQGAIDSYKRALQLALPSTPIEEVNDVRWQLCRCFYQTEQFEEASIVGEFVARRFPTDRQAKICANVALDSAKKLYLAVPKDQPRDEETARLMSLAELIAKNWPNDDEAAESLKLLIALRMGAKDYEGVIASLAQIPEASHFRAEAEMKAGQAFWAQYVVRQNELNTKAAPGAPVAADATADQLKSKAVELLRSSVKRFQSATPTAASVVAMVTLADVYVKTNNPAGAAALLEDPASGPMVLLEKEETKGLFDAALTEQTCRVALSAQLAILPTAGDPAAAIAKATKAMEKLTETMKSIEGADPQRIVATYYGVARDMKQLLDLTTDPKVKLNIAGGAEQFLIGVRETSLDPDLLRWVAETFLGFGESFDGAEGQTPKEAKQFYTQAANGFEAILKLESDKKLALEPAVKDQVLAKFAASLRKLGQYQAAFDVMLKLLTDPVKRNSVNLQLEAAHILAEWGVTGSEKHFNEAIQGRDPDPAKKTENIIWGAAKISNLARRDPRFTDAFFDARLIMYQCYLGRAKKSPASKSKTDLTNLQRELTAIYRLYPKLGGPERYAKFDQLMRRAQREMGEAEVGFSKITVPSATPAPVKSVGS
jgi:hypothetical protein